MRSRNRRALVLAAAAPAPDITAGMSPARAALYRQHAGGTLRLTDDSSFGTIDPAINYLSKGAEVFYPMFDQLVTFRHATKGAFDLVPDLADAMPAVTDSGRTYIFHLRDGIRFSDGRPVTPADVVATMERLFKVNSPNTGSWYNVIVGGDACLAHGATCTLPQGVVADAAARTVTFHLMRADSEFLYKMAFPFASILPADTPAHDLGAAAPPTTGAYRVESYDPRQRLILVRNPYFREFDPDAQPQGYADRIDYEFGLQGEAAVTAIINDQFDWMFATKPLDRLTELGAKYGARVHIGKLPEYYYMPLNVNLPPFNNKDARLAVAYAVDRRALVKLFGGSHLATPLCQFVPDNIPG